jgi:hypothetical protein
MQCWQPGLTVNLQMRAPEDDRDGFIAKMSEITKNLNLSFNMCADAAWFHGLVLGTIHHFLQLNGFYCRTNSIRHDGPWFGNTWIDTAGTEQASVKDIKTCHDILWEVFHRFIRQLIHCTQDTLESWMRAGSWKAMQTK